MQNIVLDFTVNKSIEQLTVNQPLAVMPAELAKRLLQMYAENLVRTSSSNIIRNFKATINVEGTVEQSVDAALTYIQERELVNNVMQGNWDVYTVEQSAVAIS